MTKMVPTGEAKAAIAFSVMLAANAVFDVASGQANPSWGTEMKEALGNVGPVIVASLPVLLLLVGLAITWIWQGNHLGLILAMVLGLLVSIGNIPVAAFRLMAEAPQGAVICLGNIVLGGLVAWFAYQALAEVARKPTPGADEAALAP